MLKEDVIYSREFPGCQSGMGAAPLLTFCHIIIRKEFSLHDNIIVDNIMCSNENQKLNGWMKVMMLVMK